MTCIDDETLFSLAERRFPREEMCRLGAHLDTCSSCLELVAAVMQDFEARATEDREVIAGRYEILRRVGEGSMGVVYAAHDLQLDRIVALKVVRDDFTTDAIDRQARLWREAQALARVSHPNLVSVFDVVRSGEQIFVAMEYVAGCSAREWQKKTPRSWRETLQVYIAAGRGLAAAHDAGLVHRDFKPDNVLVRDDGQVRVSDFGLAVLARNREPAVAAELCLVSPSVILTRAGAVVGTPAYMAPAQLRGAPATPASDQFSFCVAVYEAVFGQRPFAERTRRALLEADRSTPPARPAKARAPESLRRVLLRGLSAEEDQRFESMHALVDALAASLTERRRRVTRAILATATAIFLAGLARGPRPPDCPPPQRLTDGIWDGAEREALLAELGARAISRPKIAQLDQTMRAYLGEWTKAYEATCASTFKTHELDQRAFFLRMACLQGRLDEARGWVRSLPTRASDPFPLPSPSECGEEGAGAAQRLVRAGSSTQFQP